MSGLMFLILVLAGAALAILIARRGDPIPAPWLVTGLAAIDIAGILGLLWAVATMLYHDGIMPLELGLCLVPAVILAVIVRAGFDLARRDRVTRAIGLLAIGAVPVLLVAGFLLYLDANPIDWR